MSRAQEGSVYNTASTDSATNEAATQKSEATEQQDINEGQSQLAKFAADNPYVEGGQQQTATNRELSGTAGSTSAAAKAGEQALATRTGQNPATAVAAGEATQEAAQRELGGQEAGATTSRLASDTGYNTDVLDQGTRLTAEQQALTGTEAGQAQGELGTSEQAAQTPSFLDELGNGLIQGGIGAGQIAEKAALG